MNASLKKYSLLILLSLAGVTQIKAQAKTMDSATRAATVELTNIALAADAYNNQQFDLMLISSDGTVSDTATGNCIIVGDNYKYTFDSVQQIQNNFMNLEIHSDGKIFVVNKPTSFTKQFFKGNIDQSLFQQMNVNTISISTIGANKKITFNFLTESEYKDYTITYDPSNFRVLSVYVKTKIADGNGNYSTTDFITTNITFQNFTSVTPGSVSFDTSPYVFIGTNNVIQKQAAYSDYQVVDLIKGNN